MTMTAASAAAAVATAEWQRRQQQRSHCKIVPYLAVTKGGVIREKYLEFMFTYGLADILS